MNVTILQLFPLLWITGGVALTLHGIYMLAVPRLRQTTEGLDLCIGLGLLAAYAFLHWTMS